MKRNPAICDRVHYRRLPISCDSCGNFRAEFAVFCGRGSYFGSQATYNVCADCTPADGDGQVLAVVPLDPDRPVPYRLSPDDEPIPFQLVRS